MLARSVTRSWQNLQKETSLILAQRSSYLAYPCAQPAWVGAVNLGSGESAGLCDAVPFAIGGS